MVGRIDFSSGRDRKGLVDVHCMSKVLILKWHLAVLSSPVSHTGLHLQVLEQGKEPFAPTLSCQAVCWQLFPPGSLKPAQGRSPILELATFTCVKPAVLHVWASPLARSH